MNRRQPPERIRTIKKTTLVISLIVGLTFSMMIGVIGVARGLGSLYPQLNLLAQPFVCLGEQLSYEQHRTQLGGAAYWTVSWSCGLSYDSVKEIDGSEVFMWSGAIYGVVIFVVLLLVTYLYWNSNIGPAKNDGLRLW